MLWSLAPTLQGSGNEKIHAQYMYIPRVVYILLTLLCFAAFWGPSQYKDAVLPV